MDCLLRKRSLFGKTGLTQERGRFPSPGRAVKSRPARGWLWVRRCWAWAGLSQQGSALAPGSRRAQGSSGQAGRCTGRLPLRLQLEAQVRRQGPGVRLAREAPTPRRRRARPQEPRGAVPHTWRSWHREATRGFVEANAHEQAAPGSARSPRDPHPPAGTVARQLVGLSSPASRGGPRLCGCRRLSAGQSVACRRCICSEWPGLSLLLLLSN